MFTWLRRLIGREQRPPVRPAGAARPATISASAPVATPVVTAVTSLAAPASTVPPDPSAATESAAPVVSLDAQWSACLAEADALRRAHPVAATQPDAEALLGLLAQEPDALIRQLPAAARGAIALCDDATLSRSELASRLMSDPALVQALLRMANSAAMGAGRAPVLGIAQALDRIGVAGAQAVILASCVDGLLSRPGGAFDWMASRVWSHMVRTAPLARALAPAFNADADEAFAIALLHDVGKLVVFDRLSVLRAAQRRQIAIDTDFMHHLLQLLHEPLGALAAQQWSMGDRAASAIGSHHRQRGNARPDALAEVVFLAERIDLATYRTLPVDLDVLWAQGQLTGLPERATAALQRLRDAA